MHIRVFQRNQLAHKEVNMDIDYTAPCITQCKGMSLCQEQAVIVLVNELNTLFVPLFVS